MNRVAISVIIVNFNGEKYLRDCLRSLSAQTFRNFEVVVVDNGSSDNSLSIIGKEFPEVRTVSLPENTGFARGNNIGFTQSCSKYVATLNNDTITDQGWLEALYLAAEPDDDIGMVASKIFLGREGNELDSAGMLVYPDGMARQRGRGETDTGQFDGSSEVLFPSACAALYRREMLEEIGFFDEDFFSYCEDADLGLRARLAGWKAVLAPGASVRHLYSQTGGKYSSFKIYHVERNHFWVLLKTMPFFGLLFFPLYTAWRYVIASYGIISGKGSAARFAEGSGAMRTFGVLARAYWGAISGTAMMLKKRRTVRRTRRISAKEYRMLLKRHRITAMELMLRD